jgi:hypothetical protein
MRDFYHIKQREYNPKPKQQIITLLLQQVPHKNNSSAKVGKIRFLVTACKNYSAGAFAWRSM